ncbi:MAG: PEP-CTERM sorting domain-containing protein [Aquincola sp.]|nr:PEP-CTERM sorting domain-containing protein [Aquincola sp.]
MAIALTFARTAAALAVTLSLTAPAHALRTFDFSLGTIGSGVLTTTDTADANGYFLVTAIQGQLYGNAITGLQATGTPVPLNDWPVDNLVRADGGLTTQGIGFSVADGRRVNVYLNTWWSPPTVAVYAIDSGGDTSSAIGVSWRTTPVASVPEPASAALALAGLAVVGGATVRRRRAG